MVIVTGGAGFIGSAFVWKLNREGIDNILIVDNVNTSDKWKNLVPLRFAQYQSKFDFYDRMTENEMPGGVSMVVHLGACSSTTETDMDYLYDNNVEFSQKLAEWSIRKKIPFIYASSAATYGEGENGFTDDHSSLAKLRPVNRYGYSKQLFDLWLQRNHYLDKVTGIKFFNVFGPNEYHKGDMSSVIFKAFHKIKETGKFSLFKSHREGYRDGEQKRDFIYIKDVVDVIWYLSQNPDKPGIYNLGTGIARSWNDLILAVFSAMELPPRIDYVDMPENLRGAYQYFTQAEMSKLKNAGFTNPMTSLEDSIRDYVRNYLATPDPFLT